MTFIGIDNGVSGQIGILGLNVELHKMPVRKCLSYTKTKQFLNRVNASELERIFMRHMGEDLFCLLERPMVNPKRWKASMSAMRCLEATETILEVRQIPYQFIDSKEWQKALLPSGLEGEELKLASLQVGKRLFPHIDFKGFKDADGLLIAEYARRTH